MIKKLELFFLWFVIYVNRSIIQISKCNYLNFCI